MCFCGFLRKAGAGWNATSSEVQQAMFAWFTDARGSLKGCLPLTLFQDKVSGGVQPVAWGPEGAGCLGRPAEIHQPVGPGLDERVQSEPSETEQEVQHQM